jgi:hypothetical protein
MIARTALLSLAGLVLVTLLRFSPAGAGPWIPKPGEYYSEIRGDYFSAHTFRDETGNRPFLVGGGDLEMRSLVSYNELGWKPRISFALGIPVVSLTRRLENGLSRTETGLSDLRAALKVMLMDGPSALAFEVEWKAPLGYNRQTFPRLGDGQQDISGLVHFGASMPRFNGFVQAAGGYRYRFEDPEDEIRGSIDLGVWIGPSILVAGRYDAAFALQETPTGDAYAHQVGPAFIYRVDDRIDMIAGSTHTAAGKNTLHTDRYYVGVAVKQTRLNRLQGFLGSKRRP